MTDQRPDTGEPTASTDTSSTAADPGEAEATPEQPVQVDPEVPAGDTETVAATDSGEAGPAAEAAAEAEPPDETAGTAEGSLSDTTEDEAEDLGPVDADGGVAAADEVAAAAAVAGVPAWTTTPVAPDPEATEAALAALAAKPEVTLEPPEEPPLPPEDGEPSDEGTPVLLVGGILVGAFIVALAIVLILFRPFDSGTDVDASLSPSPVVTAVPSASPSAEAMVDTPDFQGLDLVDAELTAEDYGLVVRANPVETDDFAPNTVIGQEPPPGEAVPPGTLIELSVAVPLSAVAVPDLVDRPEAAAIAALIEAGLVPGTRSEVASDSIVAGHVISSDPAAASEVAPGSAVAYVVSTGPAPVAVPDLVDRPEAAAIAALIEAGLVPGTRSEAASDSIVAGHVISSDPAAASEVAPGSAVAYVVSTGPAPVAVPDLVDRPEAAAIAALIEAGLVPGTRSEAASDSIVAGHVISSDPAAASEVAPGSAVAYVVSTGPAPVDTPDFIGMSLEAAVSCSGRHRPAGRNHIGRDDRG